MSLRVRVNVSSIIYAFLFSFLVFHYGEAKAASVQLDFSNNWSLTFDDNITTTRVSNGMDHTINTYGNTDFDNYTIPVYYKDYDNSYTSWYNSSSLSIIRFNEGYYKRNRCWRRCSSSYGYHQITLRETNNLLFSIEQDITDVLVSALNVENLFTKSVACRWYFSSCSQKVTLEHIFVDGVEQFKQTFAVPTPSITWLMLIGFVGLIVQRKFI